MAKPEVDETWADGDDIEKPVNLTHMSDEEFERLWMK